MSILVVAPHPDDESLGCGGAVLSHVAAGEPVDIVFVTSGELGLPSLAAEEAQRTREEEARRAAQVLGARRTHFLRFPDWYVGEHVDRVGVELDDIVAEWSPELVYAPHADDAHPDHAATSLACRRLLRRHQRRAMRLLGYEIWSPLQTPDELLDISHLMQRKLDAVACHASQLGYYRYDAAIEALNRYRGLLGARVDHAEAFAVMSGEDG